ncbi:MAG: sigma-54-dependent Fis family transcriptional regulator [Acidobacteria bacterium]|nr:sigma-54-dependent Fis family transcriptional regulator [Candidatus Sulfomarinibacter kjeldsenii]
MANGERILVVDDSPPTVEVIVRNLMDRGYLVWSASSVTEAIRMLESATIDLVITDMKMPGIGGLELVRHVRENFEDTQVVMITGYPSIDSAVEAVKSGADEYLAKPFTDEELLSAVEKVVTRQRLHRADEPLSDGEAGSFHGILGRSEPMQNVYRAIHKAAFTPATVLISGESGTGKELIARAIHYSSPRSSARFVAVNCGGIPEGLLESELFGHMKGAFTGATESRAGFFQTADGGTILLDEVSETSLAMQVKLLRVLQDREVCMVGSTRPREVNVRVLAATNKDLQTLIAKGLFREDLFFRLNVISIVAPPLRERPEDIVQLSRYFVDKFASEYDLTAPHLNGRVDEALLQYPWPGNVRELENLMQRLVVMSPGEAIKMPHLPRYMRFTVASERGLDRTLAEVEREHIRNVLAQVGGNKTQAARVLGIDRKTLRQKLKRIEG